MKSQSTVATGVRLLLPIVAAILRKARRGDTEQDAPALRKSTAGQGEQP
jgi:hypothetical protein